MSDACQSCPIFLADSYNKTVVMLLLGINCQVFLLRAVVSTLTIYQSLRLTSSCLIDFADKLFDPIKYQTEVEKRQEQMRVFEEGEDNEEVRC